MLSFKEFLILIETPQMMDIDTFPKEKFSLEDEKVKTQHEKMLKISDYKRISKLGKYEVWHSDNINSYHLVDPKTKETHIKVQGQNLGNNVFQTKLLQASKNSPVKAHQFYHHLITRHNLILQSSELHSPGGAKTWQRLHNHYPDVRMMHVSKGLKPLNLNPDWNKNYSHKLSKSTFLAGKR